MSMLDPKTSQMFYFTGEKNTAPNCPVELMPNFNPSAGVPSYLGSDKACSRNAIYKIPFFLEWLGPRYMQWSVNAHEARPGHHTQVSSMSFWSGYLTYVGSFRFSSEFSRLYHHDLVLAMQHIIIGIFRGELGELLFNHLILRVEKIQETRWVVLKETKPWLIE